MLFSPMVNGEIYLSYNGVICDCVKMQDYFHHHQIFILELQKMWILLHILAFFGVFLHVLWYLTHQNTFVSKTLEANQSVLSRAFRRVPICIFDFMK